MKLLLQVMPGDCCSPDWLISSEGPPDPPPPPGQTSIYTELWNNERDRTETRSAFCKRTTRKERGDVEPQVGNLVETTTWGGNKPPKKHEKKNHDTRDPRGTTTTKRTTVLEVQGVGPRVGGAGPVLLGLHACRLRAPMCGDIFI